jgi:Leucine-rich repeat (LRR) protein
MKLIITIVNIFLIFAASITIFLYKRDIFNILIDKAAQLLTFIAALIRTLLFFIMALIGLTLFLSSFLSSGKTLNKPTINANEYLEQNYPKDGMWQIYVNNRGKNRAEITELNIYREGLLGTLDLSDFIQLEKLQCWCNQLTSLNVNHCLNLNSLEISNNKLKSLNISNCVKLTDLHVSNNQLTSLTLPNSDKLIILFCYGNQLSSLEINDYLNLKEIWVTNNQLTKLDLTQQVNLEKLYCYQNKLTQLVLPGNGKLKFLYCSDNQLNSIEISDCFKLEELNVSNNQLTKLDCTNNPYLKNLQCNINKLTELILPNNNQLTNIDVTNNLLTFFNYTALNPTSLIDLRLCNNNLQATNLKVFSNLVNLTHLEISNGDNWVKSGRSNHFYGSLQNCTKLNYLYISNTNVNSGLEYLPASLKDFRYDSLASSHFKVKEIEIIFQQQAILLNKNYYQHNWKTYLNNWKIINCSLITLRLEYESTLNKLDLILDCKGLKIKQLTNQFLQIFIFWIEDEIRDLRNELYSDHSDQQLEK